MIKLLGCEESISNQYTLLTTVERGEGRLEFLFWHQPAKFEKAVGLKPQRNLRRMYHQTLVLTNDHPSKASHI